MNAESPALARNMSAPPRTTLSFAALVPAPGATGDAVADGAGLTFVCRLDARALLPKARQNRARDVSSARISSMFTTAFESRSSMRGRKRQSTSALRTRALAKSVRGACRDRDRRVARPARHGVARRRRAAAIRIVPARRTESERAILRSFNRTLAILARRRGTLFLRDAEPIVWSAVDGEVLDLWTPAIGARERAMNARCDSAALAARIYSSFPVAQSAFARLLHLLDIEATDSVPTAAVTLGDRSRLLLNPKFVAENCPADHDLVMLVLHELHHVALGHTRLFPRLTPAQNWAFDCVINAQLCRLYPEPHHTALFRRFYRADAMPRGAAAAA